MSQVKKVAKKWLDLKDDEVIDVVVGVYIANQLDTDPIWMILIGPPSSAKTELLRALGKNSGTEFVSSLTPATLVSGLIAKGKNPDPSLIYKLDNKLLVLKEFSSVLSIRSEAQQEILAQLREIYDGDYKKTFGNGKVVEWKGHVGLIAACTPAYDRHHAVIGSLGDRFLLFRHHNLNPIAMGRKAIKDQLGHETAMRNEFRDTFADFLSQFRPMKDFEFIENEKINEKLVYLSALCAHGRCAVERNRYDQTIEYIPEPEGPPRLAKQLKSLAVGIALAQGKKTIDNAVYQIIKKVGRDLIQSKRLVVFKHLWDNKAMEFFKEWQTTTEIADSVGIPGTSARLVLEDLQLAGLLNRQRGNSSGNDEPEDRKGRKPYSWQINELGDEYIANSGIFDGNPDLENAPF